MSKIYDISSKHVITITPEESAFYTSLIQCQGDVSKALIAQPAMTMEQLQASPIFWGACMGLQDQLAKARSLTTERIQSFVSDTMDGTPMTKAQMQGANLAAKVLGLDNRGRSFKVAATPEKITVEFVDNGVVNKQETSTHTESTPATNVIVTEPNVTPGQ